jgi:uncharacterized protein YciI
MLWAIHCTDKPNTDALRAENLQIHREYLGSQKGIIILAGATVAYDCNDMTGSVFIVNVGSRDEAKAFSDGDPFTKAGIFANVTIQRMRKGQWNPESIEGA